MKARTSLTIVAVVFAALVLPTEVFAQFTKNSNQSRKLRSVLVGGSGNFIGANTRTCFLGGGESNNIPDGTFYAVVGGGNENKSSGSFSTVAGGYLNWATGNSAFIGGGAGNRAQGQYSVVPGGYMNEAADKHSFAAGHRARANHEGCFVWADSTDADFASGGTNQFLVRAKFVGINRSSVVSPNEVFGVTAPEAVADYGGMYVRTSGASAKPFYGYSVNGNADAWTYVDGSDANKWKLFTGGALNGATRMTVTANGLVGIGTTTPAHPLQMASGAYVSAGGQWNDASDVNRKQNFRPVDSKAILAKVFRLPVTKWNYIAEPGVDHIGPMAQDFRAAFGLGNDDKTIGSVDRDGVMYAAIQGLVEELKERDKEIAELKTKSAEIDDLKTELRALRERVQSYLPPAP